MEQVEEICDHIILVNKGEKILDGTVEKIKQDFKENIFEVEFDQKVLPEHTAIHLFDLIKAKEKSVVIRKNADFSNNEIISYFIHKGLSIHSFNEILPSINDIFIKLVQGSPEARQFQP
jgi:ABC-2 type transport system ATP-binding protein